MSTGRLDLDALARRLANRDSSRTEANVQSDLHALLLAAPLELEEHDLRYLEIVLEQQAGARRRIDVEAGLCVFEVKRDLRKGNVRADAVDQLAGYVASRTRDMNQRYVGVLTDGAEWHLFHLLDDALSPVSSYSLDPSAPNIDGLCVWLEGVLATVDKISPTPQELERRLGASSAGYALDASEIRTLYLKGRQLPGVRVKRELWARLLTTAFGTGFANSDELFVDHTLLVITAEIIAHAVIGLDPNAQDVSPATILSGHLFAQAQVSGVVDADFFDWVLDVDGGESFVKGLSRRLTRFAWRNVEHDVLNLRRAKAPAVLFPVFLGHRALGISSRRLEDRPPNPAMGNKRGKKALDLPLFPALYPLFPMEASGQLWTTLDGFRSSCLVNLVRLGLPETALDAILACPEGLEPPTPSLEGWCSIQLSYGQLGRST